MNYKQDLVGLQCRDGGPEAFGHVGFEGREAVT